jgi:Undecaprenyl-phosphate glucose phosphotransferase
MAVVSSREIRALRPTGEEPRAPRTNRPTEALEELRAETTQPAFPRDVLIGLTGVAEAGLVLISGAVSAASFGAAASHAPLYGALLLTAALLVGTASDRLRLVSIAAFRAPLRQLLKIAGCGALLLATLAFGCRWIGPEFAPPRAFWLGWFVIGLAAFTLERLALARFVNALARAGKLERRVAVIGGGDAAVRLLEDLEQADPAEYRLLGVFDDRNDERAADEVAGYPKLGNVDDLVDFARAARVDLIIFALPITAEARIQAILRKLWVLPIDIRLAAHANRLKLRPRAYSYIGRAPMLDIFDKPLRDWDLVLKSAFDRIVGAFALIALSPVMIAAAIAVKLESKGPVLFRQKRYGFNNEVIEIFKFRSMYVEQLDAEARRQVTRDDPRVTKVGRFLRRTSIDELPQLFNVVFKGNLSLVGPRPHAMYAKAADRAYDEVVESYFARHRVKPGLTGWAQVCGWRGETDTPEKIQQRVEHDLYYIENWSMGFDLWILARTPFAVLSGANAY